MRSKLVLVLALLGVSIGLVGWGVSAVFTDSSSATASIKVGTLHVQLFPYAYSGDNLYKMATVSDDGKSITCNSYPLITSSAAGSMECKFWIENTGDIPANVSITASTPTAPFLAKSIEYSLTGLAPFSPASSFTMAAPSARLLYGGLTWPELTNDEMGNTYSVTYTITATA